MNVFEDYASFYDAMYADKDYATEAAFALGRLGVEPGARVLEFGSGTGRHAIECGRLGYKVTGIERSEPMLREARARVANTADATFIDFVPGDARDVRLGTTFPAAFALFHVVSYLTSNKDLREFFETVACHLQPGGRLFFDFWYGPAVLSDPPTTRVKRFQMHQQDVMRIAEPELRAVDNCVDVRYEITSTKDSVVHRRIVESHSVRYLFMPEISDLLQRTGFEIRSSGRSFDSTPPAVDSWFAWVCAQRR